MRLALRTTAASDATLPARFAAGAIKVRLVSQYCHGGIVIGNTLWHATAQHGVICADFTPESWDLIDLGDVLDADALARVLPLLGAGYDWFSLLAFVIPSDATDAQRWYCFELCWFLMTGENPNFRVTPEMLLKKSIELRGN